MEKRTFRRFTYQDRLKIEALYNAKMPVKKIAAEIGFHFTCVYKELKLGYYMHKNTDWTYTKKYSADLAQEHSKFNTAGRAKDLKIGNDYKFVEYVEDMILNQHYSPEALLAEIKKKNLKFKTKVSVRTIYRYIDNGIFPNLTRKALPYKGKREKKKKESIVKTDSKLGKTIDRRPEDVCSRLTFGHWELDSVIGKREKGETLLVFTERKTRYQLIFRSTDKTCISTIKVLNYLEKKLGRKFNKIFKTITCDNGVEFSLSDHMEKSHLGNYIRSQIYYCHPYCSSERGSNEKQNQMIRRWIPKSTKIENYSDEYIQRTAEWLNNYPRGIFDYQTSRELFQTELRKLGIKIFA